MKNYRFPLIAAALLLVSTAYAQPEVPERGFVTRTQAKTWEEGLISGNGTIGANMLGDPAHEVVILTHERMFLPEFDPVVPPDQSGHLPEIRRLIDQGLYHEATALQAGFSGQDGFLYPDPLVPVCDLNIDMAPSGTIRDYRRSVDFSKGEALVYWKDDKGAYERRLFVSRADGVVVMKLRAMEGAKLNCSIRFERRTPSNRMDYKHRHDSYVAAELYLKDVEQKVEQNRLYYRHGFTRAYPGSIQSIESLASIQVKGGSSRSGRTAYEVSQAEEVMLLMYVEPNYNMVCDKDKHPSHFKEMEARLSALPWDYDALLEKHAAIHGELFNRVKLDLGSSPQDRRLTTEELFARSSQKQINTALMEKEFDAGRYNILCSVGELPPVLQGVWAGTFVPDWASVYTHNGNAPAAVAALMMGNMPELMKSYTSYIESLVSYFEINARHLFGCRGIVLPPYTGNHGYNNAYAAEFAGGFWISGAAWAAHFFYDYYLYTGDRTFLREHALPFMEKVALFYEDFLYPGKDGKYVFSPTQSPENWPANSDSQGSFNATMDVAAAKELLRNLVSASETLGVHKDKIPEWKKMVSLMPDYMIDDKGMFKEWLTPRLLNADDHRHSSQLYPLYDGFPVEFAESPELVEAVRNSVNYKLQKHWRGHSSGYMAFGLAQLGMVGASIGDDQIVYEALGHLVNRFWLNNMASMHNEKTLFNTDISGGMIAVMIKMLVFSDPGTVKLLPAMPPAWDKGSVEGLLCRGQIRIDRLSWNGSEVEVKMTSQVDQKIALECGKTRKTVALKAGRPLTLNLAR